MSLDLLPPPAAPRSLTTSAFEQLRADILAARFAPSERLRIQALAAHYGIGATAIREALSRLVADGLVDAEDQRGFRVAPVSREDLIDLTQTRIDIEGLALDLATEHGDLEWETAVLAAWHRVSKTPLPGTPELQAGWAAAHRQFHEALLAGCGSPWMLRVCRLLYDKSERYRCLAQSHTTAKRRDALAEHRALAEAVIARDRRTARRLLAEHYRETTDIILEAAFSGR